MNRRGDKKTKRVKVRDPNFERANKRKAGAHTDKRKSRKAEQRDTERETEHEKEADDE